MRRDKVSPPHRTSVLSSPLVPVMALMTMLGLTPRR